MDQPKPKQKRVLQVRASFEVSRLSSEYLANAYEQILPTVRRATSNSQSSVSVDLNLSPQPLGEDNHECS
jgi:hypothetical protein